PGEYDRAEAALAHLRTPGIKHVRTGLCWAASHTPEGKQSFDWLFAKLASDAELLPCYTYPPPWPDIEANTSSPPGDTQAYGDIIDVMITEHGHNFDWVELWNEPNNLNDWDWRLDPDWRIYSDMVGKAAYWANQRGKKTVLAG